MSASARGTLDVSVIVPVYQGARFLPLALRSIARQTRPPREVIVVDDGSTDGSGDVAESFRSRLPCELVVLRQANGGLSAAMNAGLARARAAWILELDADDYLAPDALESFCGAARDGVDVVASHFRYFRFRPAWLRWLRAKEIRWPLPSTDEFRRTNSIVTTSLARRSKVVACGGWDVRLRRHQDWDLWLRMWDGSNFVRVDRQLVHVHLHRRSMSADVARMTRHREIVRAHWRTRYEGVAPEEL